MSAANHPPTPPKPNCGSQSTQPAPGLNAREWASGTNINHDSASTMSEGIRTSPAPRRQAPLEMLSPSNN